MKSRLIINIFGDISARKWRAGHYCYDHRDVKLQIQGADDKLGQTPRTHLKQ